MKTTIEIIPHKKQRYPTCGDWFFRPNGDLVIRVSEEVGGWREQYLIAVHELCEVLMCKDAGVTQKQVDKFDMRYEKERTHGLRPPTAEPGDDSEAPYYRQHQIASGIERILGAELKVDWNTYADNIERLP